MSKRSGFGIGVTGVLFTFTAACTGYVSSPPKPVCTGTALSGDPSGRPSCAPPDPPVPTACQSATTSVTQTTMRAPGTLEAEVMTAVDPRPNSKVAYAATTEATVMPGPGPTGKCITGKRIRVYRSQDLGATWSDIPGNDSLPQGQWATDPDISVGHDGTLYLVLLRLPGNANCNTDPDMSRRDVQLWFAPPGGTLQPALAPGSSPFNDGAPAVGGVSNAADHPQIVASPTLDGQVTVYSIDQPDFIATFQRNGSQFTEVAGLLLQGHALFANLAMDNNGNLFVATGSPSPAIQSFSWTGSSWQVRPNGTGTPPVAAGATYVNASTLNVPSNPAVFFLPDPTPALAVTQIGSATDTIVYVGFDVTVGNVRQTQILAANASNLALWTPPAFAPVPVGNLAIFHPSLSADGTNNILDLVVSGLAGTAGAAPTGIALKTFFYRFNASTRQLALGPTDLTSAPPSVFDLPSRHADAASLSSLFPGEYLGLATKSRTAIAAYPTLAPAGIANVDLALAAVTNACGQALSLTAPDSLWECTCQCGSGEFSFAQVVGCAPGAATTASAACGVVCGGNTICGSALACLFRGVTCAGTATGLRLSAQSCTVSQVAPIGDPPASTADFGFTAAASSNVIITAGSETATTSLGGTMLINASTSPPAAGTALEIARFDPRPADVFIGGSVQATARNMRLVHPRRIQGTFTDATHFQIPAGGMEMIMTVQTESYEGGLSSAFNIVAANPTPLLGIMNLASGTVSLDGTASDGAGNVLELHFRGNITFRPADSDGDGIINVVDTCPGGTVGPDRTPPTFTFVPPAITVSSCTGVSLGQATASDPCGVTVTNNAPSRFALGTTIVKWTARDGAGNVAVVTQAVTAVLDNSSSCCPVGTKIIMGTSNNDVLTGTSGADCILGLGGQDTINGQGGNDVIGGGDGNDTLNGQDGNDSIFGGAGQDTVSGGLGSDLLNGGDGVDQLNGDAGDDRLFGGQGSDVLRGGVGNDTVNGEADDDQVFGGDGNDIVQGGAGNDTLFGEAGDDELYGQGGDDQLNGGTGVNDLFGGSGNNVCVDNNVIVMCSPIEL